MRSFDLFVWKIILLSIFSSGLYAEDIRDLIPPHPKVFDVGANVGEKTSFYLSLGAQRVVCVEPHPYCIMRLQNGFKDESRVIVVPMGLSDKIGFIPFYPAKNPALSSATLDWKKGRFKNEEWEAEIEIQVTTLDILIDQYGLPDFCKIDVEGYELNVLKGLSHKIPVISFEFAYEYLDQKTKLCLQHLADLGYKDFNVALGGLDTLVFSNWIDEISLLDFLKGSTDPYCWGDIYAR